MSVGKNVLRTLLGYTGYELRRRVVSEPAATFDLIELVLKYCATETDSTYVQIGACDGKSGDSANSMISQGHFARAVLVEPVSANFEQLAAHYRDVKNVYCEHAAVGWDNGVQIMYGVNDDGRWKNGTEARQWSSFDRQHLLRHGVRESEIIEHSVPTTTLARFLEAHEIRQLDVLQIDTEGFDAEIVRMAVGLEFPPKYIYFEFIHVKNELPGLLSCLAGMGYRWAYDRWNVLAVRGSAEKLTL